MNYVQPIRDRELINSIADYLNQRSERDAIMFLLGINVGCRISDILKLRVKDLKGKDRLCIIEKKTGKPKYLPIPLTFNKTILQPYLNKCGTAWKYIFCSRENNNVPITRQRAYQIIKNAGREFGIDDLGTHTLRKTFGYWYYQKHHSVADLMKIFNHSEEEITLRYIGVMDSDIEKNMKKFDLTNDYVFQFHTK